MATAEIDYPAELDSFFTLPDDSRIRIRPLRRCEDGPIRELFARLSPETRYLRFFSPFPSLPESVVRLLACVDYRRQLALVAEHPNGDGDEVVGLASFGAVDDEHAEVALVVRDDWQRHRIGTELAIRVLQAAQVRGFHRFVAHMTANNLAIRKILAQVGEVVASRASGGIVETAFVPRRSI